MPNLLKKETKKIKNNFGISFSYFRISEIEYNTYIIEHKIVGCSFLFGMLTSDSSTSFVISCFIVCRSSSVFSLPFFPLFSFMIMKVMGLFVLFSSWRQIHFFTQSWSWQRLKSQRFNFFVGDSFSSSSTSNFLCIPSFEILKVVLIGSDLPDIPGLKDEWINNFAECCWIGDNAISILANWIENEMLCLQGPLYPFVNAFFFFNIFF